MTVTPDRSRTLRALSISLLSLFVAASPARNAGSDVVAARVTKGASRFAHTPVLPRPLADMLADGSLFPWIDGNDGPDFVQDNGKDWPRACNGFVCSLPLVKGHAHLTTQAAEGTQKLSLEHLPQPGVVFARIQFTKGEPRRDDKWYGLSTSYDTFYLIVEGTEGQQTAAYTIVGRSGNTSSIIVSKKPFVYCDPKGDAPSEAYSGMHGCKTDHPKVQAALQKLNAVRAQGADTASALSELWRALGVADGLTDSEEWVTCVHGCCIAQY